MEEKKNNALEKVEKVINNNSINQKPYSEVYGVNVVDSTQLEPTGVIYEQRENRERQNDKQTQSQDQSKSPKNSDQGGKKDKKRGFGGWLAAVITLGVACLALSVALALNMLVPSMGDNMLESSYNKSFYDAVKQVDNIDLNLSKLLATKDTQSMQKYLVDTAINSELAENDLQELPLKDESKFYTTKLVNQIGDYSKYLNEKLIDGEQITAADMKTLSSLYSANLTLKNALHGMADDMGEGFSMTSVLEGGNGNLVVKGFNDLEHLSVDYPELIYDGPFSDGQENREMKGLSGEEITSSQAVENFKKIFKEYSFDEIACDSQTSGRVSAFNVTAKKDDEVVFAQFTKTGGKMILYSFSGSCNGVNIDQEKAIGAGEKFLKELGIEDMKAVWINLANDVYTINFAYTKGDVVVYSDLIKIRVCAETGMVIGLEAKSYYTNHTERVIGSPSISVQKAKTFVFDQMEIETARLAIVPIGESKEKLCYEFSGEYDGSVYYVYIDATSGRQVEMFKVIESTEGEMLM